MGGDPCRRPQTGMRGLTAAQLAASLSMPRTAFPLRPDHAAAEARYRAQIGPELYRWQQQQRRGAPEFLLQDGPPFANGDLHIGHALNKVLKDVALRFSLLKGMRVTMVPGWDCHGLPIELKARQAEAGAGGGPLAVRARCRRFAAAAVARQRADCEHWALLGDLDAPYQTMDAGYEARQLRVFARFLERGLVSAGLRPVHWSPSSRTALAEAELEYAEEAAVAVHARLALVERGALGALLGPADRCFLVVWTTTPWTLPANKVRAAGRCVSCL